MSHLEKAELKAAKEARQRLELERTLRRFKNIPSTGSSTGGGSISGVGVSVGREEIVSSGVTPAPQRLSYFATDRHTNPHSISTSSTRTGTSRPMVDTTFDHHTDRAGTMTVEEFQSQSVHNNNNRSVQSTPVHKHQTAMNTQTPTTTNTIHSGRFLYSSANNTTYSNNSSTSNALSLSALQDQRSNIEPLSSYSVRKGLTYGSVNHLSPLSENNSVVSNHSTSIHNKLHEYSNNRSIVETTATVAVERSSGDPSNSPFNRALLAASKIEEAMKAKGWKVHTNTNTTSNSK